MGDDSTKPDVEAIVQELREGMQDSSVSHLENSEQADQRGLRMSLRRATETADILGRCGGSLRGKLCKLLARLALPVVEQLNLHHDAVVGALQHIPERGDSSGTAEERLAKLEADVEALKQEIQS